MALLTSEQVEEIFNGNEGATRFAIPEGITRVTRDAFWGSDAKKTLREIVLPESLTEISRGTFSGFAALEKISIPGGVKKIGEEAFRNCRSLREVKICEGVQAIEDHAFARCPSLKSIEIPASVKEIGERAFSRTPLLGLSISEDNAAFGFAEEDGLRFFASRQSGKKICAFGDGEGTLRINAEVAERFKGKYGGCGFNGVRLAVLEKGADGALIEGKTFGGRLEIEGGREEIVLREVTAPTIAVGSGIKKISGAERITSSDFPNRNMADAVEIGEGTEEIGGNVFALSGVKSVSLPSTLRKIGGRAFDENSLTEISLPDSLEEIGDFAFGENSLTEISLPASLKKIGWRAFWKNKLTSVRIPDGTEEIDGFEGNPIESVEFGAGAKKIGGGAFSGTALKEIALPEGLLEIESGAFSRTKIERVRFPSSLRKVSGFAETPLKEVELPDGIEEIGNSAFRETAIERVRIPGSVKEIGKSAFRECKSLKSVEIGNGVEKIGGEAFSQTAIEKIELPESVRDIGSAFRDCAALREVKLNEGLEKIESLAGTAIETIALPPSLSKETFPSFNNCANLKEIEIPAGTKTIPRNCFFGCKSLAGVTLPEGLLEIESGAFDMSGITELRVPESVTEFDLSDEYNKKGDNLDTIKKMNLPGALKELDIIGYGKDPVCRHTRALEELEIGEGIEKISTNAFGEFSPLPALRKIRIPASLKDADRFLGRLTALEEIEVAEGNGKYAVSEGCLYSASTKKLVTAAARRTEDGGRELTVPSFIKDTLASVEMLADGFFKKNPAKLTKATVPAKLEKVKSLLESWGVAVTVADIGEKPKAAAKPKAAKPSVKPKLTPALAKATLSADRKTATVPDGTETIGSKAFMGAESLEKVILPASVKKIEKWAFRDCENLREINLGLVEEIDDDACVRADVLDLSSLQSATGSWSWSAAYNRAKEIFFSRHKKSATLRDSFVKVHIPANIETIYLESDWRSAFTGKNLKEITVEEGNPNYEAKDGKLIEKATGKVLADTSSEKVVTAEEFLAAEKNAFAAMKQLTITGDLKELTGRDLDSIEELTLPDSVEVIDIRASKLKRLFMPKSLRECSVTSSGLEEIVWNDKVEKISIRVTAEDFAQSRLKEIALPASLRSISYLDIPALANIALNEGLEDVYQIHSENPDLKEIALPSTLKKLGRIDAPNLSRISLNEGLETLGGIESKAEHFEPIALPSTLKTLENVWTEGLEELALNEGLEKLGRISLSAKIKKLRLPKSLKEFKVPPSVEEVEIEDGLSAISFKDPWGRYNSAFDGCRNLKRLVLPKSVTEIRAGAFRGCGGELDLSALEAEEMDAEVFGACGASKIVLPKNLKKISRRMFQGCPKLKELELPASVTEIEANAFEGCTALENLSLPEGLAKVGKEAFKGMTALKEIRFPKSLTRLSEGVFGNCTSLERVVLPEGSKFEVKDNALVLKDRLVVCLKSAGEEYTIPEYITKVDAGAFSCRIGVVNLHDDIEKISAEASSNAEASVAIKALAEILSAKAKAKADKIAAINTAGASAVLKAALSQHAGAEIKQEDDGANIVLSFNDAAGEKVELRLLKSKATEWVGTLPQFLKICLDGEKCASAGDFASAHKLNAKIFKVS